MNAAIAKSMLKGHAIIWRHTANVHCMTKSSQGSQKSLVALQAGILWVFISRNE